MPRGVYKRTKPYVSHTLGKHWKLSEETRKKQSQAQLALRRTLSDEQKENLRKAHLGTKQSEETRKKRSESRKGCKMSIESREKISKSHLARREKHWAWKGGITSENKVIRFSAGYKYWREMVFKRDNWTCQMCGERAKIVQAHHIKPFAEFPESRLKVSNGITLCVNCHKNYHATHQIPHKEG